MKAPVRTAVSLFVFATLLAGCTTTAPGGGGAEPEQPEGEAAGDVAAEATDGGAAATDGEAAGTLSVAGIDYDYSVPAIEAFEERHPDITVEWSPGTISFEEGEIQTLMRSGAAPDVLIVNSGPGRVGMLAETGLIASLTDIYDTLELEDVYEDWVVEQLRQQGDGDIHEIVEGVDVFQVYYNTEMFDDHGIAPPATWEEFIANCTTLRDAGVLPVTLGTRNNFAGGWHLGNLVEAAAGRDTMNEVIYGTDPFDQDEILLGGQMLEQEVSEGCINGEQAAALEWEQSRAEFFNEQAAMVVMPQGNVITAEAEGIDIGKFDTFLMPSREEGRPSRPTAGLAHSWVVNADTDRWPAVEAWLEWVSSEDYMRVAAENQQVLVPVREVPDDVELHSSIENARQALEEGAGFNPSVYLPTAAVEAWYNAVEGIVTGQTSPDEAMANVQSALAQEREG